MATKWLLTAILTILFMQASLAASPSYEDAARLYEAVEQTFESTKGWERKSPQAQIEILQRGQSLSAQAENLFGKEPFGPFGNCLWSTLALQDYTLTLSKILDGRGQVKAADISGLSAKAFALGNVHGLCKVQIRALKP